MSSLLSHNKDRPHIKKSLSDSSPTSSAATTRSLRHERPSRLSSSGSSDVSNDSTTNHAESYFLRRENRLSARKKAVEETENNDYKKMYEKALSTNQRLKSKLETSKQELVLIQDQLQRVQGRAGDCGSTVLEAERKESWSLKKRITDMEDQLKVKAELKMENQRLKDENGALIRVITKLSK
ncbi:protein phosphatase 1 regulatory subunit 12B-like isoform X2 [Hippoglossus hippoglossus]|uniref:protein phosphatase 1 regulatory subunit 12B-like isoform X2 n=1 Tax=Hippoglossus hippoglossus TaxID=8267 RepID=UPI00148E24CB|nr:protein phosphatase 1 regulatory subunit 12B-like isoform X2 [Hippoglossus hippoglossus]